MRTTPEKDFNVLIVEDPGLWRELIGKYFNKDQITYCCIFQGSERNKVVDALDKIDAETELETE